MRTKSFKIGEWAIGGIIRVSQEEDVIRIEAIDYVSKITIMEDRFHTEISGFINQMDDFLHQLTSHYYADKVLNYIKTAL